MEKEWPRLADAIAQAQMDSNAYAVHKILQEYDRLVSEYGDDMKALGPVHLALSSSETRSRFGCSQVSPSLLTA